MSINEVEDDSTNQIIGTKFKLEARAKVNLRLRVVGRRADGFHLLSMLNSTLRLCDELEVEFTDTGKIELNVDGSKDVPRDSSNLIIQAVERFQKEFSVAFGVKIDLKKNIPVGAGLAGGSADAAALLRLMGAMFLYGQSSEESRKKLAALALSLGADVPFCLRACFARVGGIGELLEPYSGAIIEDMPLLLVLPGIHISTQTVYQRIREKYPSLESFRDFKGEQYGDMLKLNTPSTEYEPWPSRTVKASLWRQLIQVVNNDLVEIVSELRPEIAEGLQALSSIKEIRASMTGSGSALFVLPTQLAGFSDTTRNEILAIASAKGWRVMETTLSPRVGLMERIG